jgi:integrase
MPNLTKRTVDALRPRAKPFIAFDGDAKGFGIRVMPSGVKTYVLEYRPGAGGRGVAKKRLTLGRHGALTAEQARKAALGALARIRLGSDPQAEKSRQRASLTVAGLIDAFLRDHAGSKLKAKTRIHYDGLLAKVRDAHGNLKAATLTRGHVASLHHAMAGTPYFANRMLAAVSSCWSWGERHGLLPEGHANPAAKISRFREEGRERFLTSNELSRLGDALAQCETRFGPYASGAIRLLCLTGARLNEVLALRWQEVDFERGLALLPDSKTGRKIVQLSAPALAVLDSLPRLDGCLYVIAGMAGRRADLQRPWAFVKESAGLEGVRLHDLRHSFASIGAGASLGLPMIGKLLGHTQAATTHRYAHLGDDPLRRASETIGATIAAAMGGARREAVVVPLAKVR